MMDIKISPAKAHSFTFDDSLEPFNFNIKDWLAADDSKVDGITTATIVFNPEGKVLLVQRASHDSMPNKWEVPGGACDAEDHTILHAASRELREESGLIAAHFRKLVGDRSGLIFSNRTGTKQWCRFAFLAEVNDIGAVQLDPSEHQDYVWADEEEVRAQKVASKAIPLTTDSMLQLILEAFKVK